MNDIMKIVNSLEELSAKQLRMKQKNKQKDF